MGTWAYTDEDWPGSINCENCKIGISQNIHAQTFDDVKAIYFCIDCGKVTIRRYFGGGDCVVDLNDIEERYRKNIEEQVKKLKNSKW